MDASYDPGELILKRNPARKTLMGKQEPATVTLREDDFYALAAVHEAALGARQAAQSIREAEQRIAKNAKEMNRNRIDSHEVSVDQRVQDAERRMSEIEEWANNEIRKAKALEQHARSQLREVEQDRDDIRNELTELQEISAFFPEEWREMEQKTERARKMEKMYYAAKQGERHPDVFYNRWSDSYQFDVDSDGKTMDLKHFLIEYKRECNKQDIAHDGEMYERAEQMEKQDRYQDHERER